MSRNSAALDRQTPEYRPAIDGLRAVAVLAVFIFHLDRRWMPGGFLGVDIFFVISGFLITSIILKDCRRGSFSFLRFYQRRIARLLAAFMAVAAVTILAAKWIYLSHDYASAGSSLAYAASDIINFKLIFQGNYFTVSPDAQPFLHCWSLSVEEQFYVFFPACILLIHRYLRKYLVAALCFGWILSLALCVTLTWMQPTWAFYLLPARAWELLTGALLVALPENKRLQMSPRLLPLLGLAAVLLSVFVIREDYALPGFWAVLPVLGAALLLNYSESGVWTEAAMAHPVMVAIGRASYSLYLWHWPIFSLVNYALYSSSPWLRLLIKILLSAIATTCSYFFIESPARRYLNRPDKRWAAYAVLAVSVVVFIPMGIAIRKANYVDASYRDVTRGGLLINASARSASVMLMGDSNGSMYGKSLSELAKKRGFRLNVISVHAGDPLPDTSGYPPSLWLSSFEAVKRERPDDLILVCNWSFKLKDGYSRLPKAIAALAPYTKRIILITQPPQQPPAASRDAIREGSHGPFFEDRTFRLERLADNDFVKTLHTDQIRVVDIEPLFLNSDGTLRIVDSDGNQLYQDANHMSDYGTELVMPMLQEQMTF